MTNSEAARILVVDDEEAILETMAFTFLDSYEVLTSTDAQRALKILDEKSPVSVVITDQRMPNMTGVEFLSRVWEEHPETVRIMLTGFADMDATIQAINDGHVFAYINKPWEPDQLKQVVKSAVDHHNLAMENMRLVEDLKRANVFLEAVMDRLDTGAVAIDDAGIVRAANRPALEYLHLEEDPRGIPMRTIFAGEGLGEIGEAVERLLADGSGSFEELDLRVGDATRRLRVNAQQLADAEGAALGSVTLFREVSHEPLRRRFDEIVVDVSHHEGELRPRLEQALREVAQLGEAVRATGIGSPSMAELSERASRAQTAIQSWLDVDDTLAREDYPDAQALQDRMRVASNRWPRGVPLPARVGDLGRRVEAYYESGENSKQRAL